jgi:hypothetical protein
VSRGQPWEQWIAEVARILGCDEAEIMSVFYQTRELLYDGGASPMEAADWLRAYVGGDL